MDKCRDCYWWQRESCVNPKIYKWAYQPRLATPDTIGCPLYASRVTIQEMIAEGGWRAVTSQAIERKGEGGE